MNNSIRVPILVLALCAAGAVAAQSGILLDYAADQMVQKFQTSTCEELKAKAKEPQTEKAKEAAVFLQNDSQARDAFVKKVAAPVLNKMFECGMIP
jgi:phosphoenolpyruvate-protein kinase (PTS system EI component)